VIDLRNVYDVGDMMEQGFRYISIGREEVDGTMADKDEAA
jgi:hypothetical protein